VTRTGVEDARASRPPCRGFWAYAPTARWTQILVPLLAVSGLVFDIVTLSDAAPAGHPATRVLQVAIAVLYTFALILLPYVVTWAAALVVATAFLSVPWTPPDVPGSTLVLTMGFVVALTSPAFIATYAAATAAWSITVALQPAAGGPVLAVVVAVTAAAAAGVGYAVRRILVDRADMAARTLLLRAELATAAADQRSFIARELHDGVAHHLTVIRMVANMRLREERDHGEGAEEGSLTTIGTSATTALGELRRLLQVLDPQGGADGDGAAGDRPPGLVEQVERVASDVRKAGVAVAVECPSDVDAGLPETLVVSLERILIEATTNVLKHGDATDCRIRLERTVRSIVLEVDSGIGVVALRPSGEGTRYGVPGMRRRATEAGGTLTAGPSDGRWVVRASIPVPY
jgi:signal transduction histidine kinase